ncbi:MAG: YbaN family protein [Pseudomonadota bacterium]
MRFTPTLVLRCLLYGGAAESARVSIFVRTDGRGEGGGMRWVWALCGFVLLAIGAVGLVLPLWPTTIFWIGAAFCLAESHPKVRDWIYAQPGAGPLIQSFVERGEISRKGKVAAIAGMLIACLISGWLLRDSWIALTVLLLTIAIAIAFVATRREPAA